MLTLDNIWAAYGPVQVLSGVSLDVPAGKVITLLGGNGSGKSTTLKTIVGAVKASAGSIRFEDREICGMEPREIVPMGISLVPQGRRIFAPLTVMENLRLGAFARRRQEKSKDDFESIYERFPEIRQWLNRKGNTLSVGQQQLVAFGRGLISRPKLLLLDEPSSGLAPILVERLGEIIKKLKEAGMTILLVEQNVHLALSVADFGYILRDGKISMAGPTASLIGDGDLISHYLGG